jgi:subtilase family serine protease
MLIPNNGYPTGNGFSGLTASYETLGFDLTSYGGVQVKLALEVVAGDNGITGDGWQIDTVSVTFQASVPRADLKVVEVAAFNATGIRISNATAGDLLELRANIANIGTASTTLSVPIVFIDGPAATGRALGQGNLPAVGAGGSAWVSVQALLPAGPRTITVMADPAGVVAEFSRANNQGAFSLQLEAPAAPDLVVFDAFYEVGGARTNGARPLDRVTANLTVANLGSASVSGTFALGVYLENGVDLVTIEERTVAGGLAPGAGENFQIAFTASEGNLTLVAAVDRQGAVAEASEENNVVRTPFPVTQDPPVDLVVDPIVILRGTVPTSEAVDGDLVQLRAPVRNVGSGAFAGSFAVGFFLGDPDAGGQLLFLRAVTGTLAAGGSVEVRGFWTAEVGQRTLYARADLSGEVFESNELNNKAGTSIHVAADSRANLVIEAVRFVVLGREVNATQVGAPVSVEVVIRNLGSNATVAGSVASAASNPWVAPPASGMERVALPTQMARNAEAVVTYTWLAVAGVRVFYFVADVDQSTSESNEFDNLLVRTLTVSPDSPDLVVGSVSVKSKGLEANTVYPGLNVTISAEVTNAGVASSDGFNVEVWAGEPGALGSLRIKTQSVEAPFVPGDTAVIKATWIASFATGGTKELVVVADPGGTIVEAERDNNAGSKEVSYAIARRPNLLVDAFTASSAGLQVQESQAGTPLLLSVTVKDDSPAPHLGGGVVEIRDGTAVIFAATLPHIEPGQSLTLETTWNARAGAQLTVTLDTLDQVAEGDEFDNQQTLTLSVKAQPTTPWPLYGGAAGLAAVGVAALALVRQRRRGSEPEEVPKGSRAPEPELAEWVLTAQSNEPGPEEPASLASSAGSAVMEASTTIGPEPAAPRALRPPRRDPAAAPEEPASEMHAKTASADAAAGELAQADATSFARRCPSCGAAVESGWQLCPNCEAPLPPS